MDPNAHSEWHWYTTDAIATLSWDAAKQKHIPFRASLRHRHSTWARTYFASPELYLKPRNVQELRLIVNLARVARKQIVVVGSGHSPSDLTCTASWMVNLDDFSKILSEDAEKKQLHVEAGIRLFTLTAELEKRGWAMQNMGSITAQSIAGVISTSSHGSSLRHGLISESCVALTIMLANGRSVECSREKNSELYNAALVSLGAIGIITHVTFQATEAFNLRWNQSVVTLPKVLNSWNDDLWTKAEFCRVWWFPYSERTIVWQANRTDDELQEPPKSWYGGAIGRFTYEALLYVARWFPSLMPQVEAYVFSAQYGWEEGTKGTAVQKSHEALTMDCLFSQLVNEWSIPLEKGPEAITRLQHWLTGREDLAKIPFSAKGVFVHAPIEVRVTNSTVGKTKPWLDQSITDGPTLYLNATLYRPFHADLPKWKTYYAAFEYVMKDCGGKPHWAKNFISVTPSEMWGMYPRMQDWVRIREQVDPERTFITEWHKRTLLSGEEAGTALRMPGDFKIEYNEESSNGGAHMA